ncbi:MAG: hypothetical protein FWC52_05095 [Candidatus Methanoplasma sp.]|nr:hypothetical protein [Candidatus Methanoplasma sp.]
MDKKPIVIVFIAIVAMLLIGEVLAFAPIYNNSADVWENENVINYSISTNTSSQYTAVLLDNNGEYDIERILVYYDPGYMAPHTNEYLEERIALTISELEVRNCPNIAVADAVEIQEALSSENESGTYHTALLMMTGVFPDTVYDATSDCLIVDWLNGGGVLYWIGDTIGTYVSVKGESTLERQHGYGEIFFGKDDEILATGKTDYSDIPSTDADIADSLNILYNAITFGVNAASLDNCISIGFTNGTYDSITFTKFHSGEGMIVLFGGDTTTDAAPVIAQAVCSGLNYSSSIVNCESGEIYRNTISGTMPNAAGATDMYIYLGTPMVIFAERFGLRGYESEDSVTPK